VHVVSDSEVHAALWAEGAERVELCVFDDHNSDSIEHRIELP